ncbi:alpha/beta hydrolase-fold protein [Phyllobacterium sp. 21LDTY02-6]|uniref:alpha/beta hydrolase n=1 Tax=Phyllobacterium sp. 21LDTY02-6 TaxID=2944903 RepID=UPI002020716E|nr:alpha/beta hydrolase-fold protein [Phyllobacterium sp. 21LDTY02-6]MCO4318927.1 alpha/beta hydrolase-fold protein [Phyllobacterium sp. 21LDTY02-6]
MSPLKNIKKKACVIVAIILAASAARAAEPVIASFDMEANGITYRIFTAAPTERAPDGGYPVVYMTDGNRMLPIAAKHMAENTDLKAVIVAIGYPSSDRKEIVRLRYFDLTPPTPDELIPVQTGVPKTGGRDKFFHFIETQVKPEIEKRFEIDKGRQGLFGHSLGGLFTLYVLFNHTSSFQSYSAADPSIWWNDRSILQDKDRFIERFKQSPLPVRLLVETSGKRSTRPGQTTQDEERLKKLRGGPSGSDILQELSGLLRMETAAHRFGDESHGSMIPLTVRDTMNFMLLGQKPGGEKN